MVIIARHRDRSKRAHSVLRACHDIIPWSQSRHRDGSKRAHSGTARPPRVRHANITTALQRQARPSIMMMPSNGVTVACHGIDRVTGVVAMASQWCHGGLPWFYHPGDLRAFGGVDRKVRVGRARGAAAAGDARDAVRLGDPRDNSMAHMSIYHNEPGMLATPGQSRDAPWASSVCRDRLCICMYIYIYIYIYICIDGTYI